MLPFRTMAEQVADLRTFSKNPQQRIRTGWESFDILVEGPASGEVFTILGRSFTGKSLMASAIVVNNRNLPNIFFSMEMPEHQVLQRMFSQWAEIDAWDVTQMVKDASLPLVLETMPDAFPQTCIIDKPSLSFGDMSAYLGMFEEYYGERPAFVVIDFLELIGGGKKSGEGSVRTEAIAGALKDWAKDERMPVFVLH
jgi:replicative DNA helicase